MDSAYAPYSGFKVGAALLTEDDKIFSGCNIESITFTPTVCAERVAIFSAVANGCKEFKKIVVCTDDENLSSPCGVCLQVMSEFCSDEFEITLTNSNQSKNYCLKDFLPLPFRPKSKIGTH